MLAYNPLQALSGILHTIFCTKVNSMQARSLKRAFLLLFYFQQAVQARKEGDHALEQTLSIENEHDRRLEDIQKQHSLLHDKEQQISKVFFSELIFFCL